MHNEILSDGDSGVTNFITLNEMPPDHLLATKQPGAAVPESLENNARNRTGT